MYEVTVGPLTRSRRILEQTVSLGEEITLIEDGIIEDHESVRRELAKRDGHIVPVRIHPFNRKGLYRFTNPPRLPNNPWDEKVESFIKLEDSLNERLAARYHELAASTVADLTPEEIEAVSARPELDEDAHVIRD